MPDLDSGHIFLTTLAPIRNSAAGDHNHTSFTQAVRTALAKLPTALQSPATEKTAINSPFAENKHTHFARMFVLNDAIYNGRVGKSALAAFVSRDNTAIAQPVDRLNTSYLVFCADIDAVEEDGNLLPDNLTSTQQRHVREAYARELWGTMEKELCEIYTNCEGFEGVRTAQDFADYLNRCHVETTMPFHDYYLDLPKFNSLPVWGLLAGVGLPLLYALVGLIWRLAGAMQEPVFGMDSLAAFIIGLIATGIAGFVAVRYVFMNGEKPLPPGKHDDLPSVLKALYLQQKFADFAVEAQGETDEDLHRNFGTFLDTHKPSDRSDPTQRPGVIGTPKG